MREENYLPVSRCPVAVTQCQSLVFVALVGYNAESLIVVDYNSISLYKLFLEKIFGAETVDVTYIKVFINSLPVDIVLQLLPYSLLHLSRGPVCERQAKHVACINALAHQPCYAFGQQMCLSAAGRSKHKIIGRAYFYYLPLTVIEHCHCFSFLAISVKESIMTVGLFPSKAPSG